MIVIVVRIACAAAVDDFEKIFVAKLTSGMCRTDAQGFHGDVPDEPRTRVLCSYQ
jgi:hypothetical protein